MRALFALLLPAVLLGPEAVAASVPDVDHLRLVTYGPEANRREGDDDFVQVVLLDVPADVEGPIRVRVFDPDAGGELDVFFGWGDFDTETRFSLYGGRGATTSPGLRGAKPTPEEVHAGELLGDEVFAIDQEADGRWVTLAEVRAEQGEIVGDRRAFKLVVEGVAGNDGNVFDVDAVGADGAPVPGLRMLSYVPTIHHATRSRTAEIRLLPSGNRRLFVHSFDAAGADLRVETRFRTIRADTSGQNTWSQSAVDLTDEEQEQVIALDLGGEAGEVPNDATLYLADEDGVVVPIQLPIRLIVPNRRPRVSTVVRPLDCERAEVDASASNDPEGGTLSFEWEFPDGRSESGPVVTHRFGTPGLHEVRLRVTDDSGQVGSGTEVVVPVTMNAPPVAQAGDDRTVAPGDVVELRAEGSHDPDGRLLGHAWDFGDGARAAGATVRHTYAEPGRRTATLTVTDDSRGPCATGIDTVGIWVNRAPTASPSAPGRAAVGEEVPFDAGGSADQDGAIRAYAWDFGDDTHAEGEAVTHAYAAPGTYRARLTVTDDAGVGNSSASAEREIVVNDPPVASAGDDREVAIAEPFEVDGGGSHDPDGEIVEYRWDFGDGGSAQGPRAVHEYAAAGRYEVRLRVRDDSATSSDTREDTLTVVVNAPPVADAGADQHVTQSELRFDASGSHDPDGEIVEYAWDFGDGTAGHGREPRHVYAAPGTYRVALRVVDDSPTPRNDARDDLQVVVNARPVADAGPDRAAAVGQAVELSARASKDPDGSIAEHRWSFGDGDEGRGETVSHVYGLPGTYTVALEVVDDTGHELAVDRDVLRVVVNAAPVARLAAPPRVAPGQSVELDGSGSYDPDGSALSYRWEVDGEPAGTRERLEERFAEPGVHPVALTVDDGSGTANSSSRVETSVHVNAAPQARAGEDKVQCEPVVALDASASADPDGDALSFEWAFGDGSPPARGQRVTHVYAEGGSYPVSLRVDDGTRLGNATDEDGLEVRVNHPPRARAGDDTTHCAGEIVLFDGSGSHDPDGDALRYVWDFGDGSSGSGAHPVHVYDRPGIFPVTLTVQDDSGLPCGRHRDRRVLRIVASPVAVAGADVDTCANAEVRFDGSASHDADGSIDHYTWDFGDGSRGNGPRPSHRYARVGTYRVVLSVEGDQVGECDDVDTAELTVKVRAAPTAIIEAPAVASPGEPLVLRAAGEDVEGALWQWDFGDGTNAEGREVEHAYAAPGRYEVGLTARADAAADCGETRQGHVVQVNESPTAMVAVSERVVAPRQAIFFSASGSTDPDGVVVRHQWSFGDGLDAEGMDVFHRYSAAGRYTARLTVFDDSAAANGRADAAVEIVVNAAPEPSLEMPAVTCVGEEIAFDGSASSVRSGDHVSYEWEFGDGHRGVGAVVRHRYEAPGVFTVDLLVDDGSGAANARARTTREVRVNRPPEARGGADRVVCAGDEVVFDGSRSRDLDGSIVAHRWTFDGASPVDDAVATHVFDVPGPHRAELSVRDDSGSSCATTVAPVRVRVNAPPVADAGGDRAGFVGGAHDELEFDARGSHDPDGDLLVHDWSFGDGTTATGPVVLHTYDRPGEYEAELVVRDGTGLPCGAARAAVRVTIAERTSP